MPGKLSDDKQRISYAEDKVKIAAMRKIAGEQQTSLSQIVRKATQDYLAKTSSK